jgi:hypothetical protein
MTSVTANPLDPIQWEWYEDTDYRTINGVSTVYSAANTIHGYLISQYNWETYGVGVNPISLPLTGIRAVRVKFYNRDSRFFSLHQVQVHGVSLYTAVANLGEARGMDDGTMIALSGQQLTAAGPYSGVPEYVAYVEELDRASAIRLDTTDVDISVVIPGDIVSLAGTLQTEGTGERSIKVDAIQYLTQNDPALRPLGINNRFAGVKAAEGLYAKVWGMVVPGSIGSLPLPDTRWCYTIDDGSGSPIKVYTDFALVPAAPFVRVLGVLTRDADGLALYTVGTTAPEEN